MNRIARDKGGFSLIEILVVLAISMVLMGLVLYPVVQTFNMTRRAQAMVDAQDAARFAMEQISRELGESMYVYDNAVVQFPVGDFGAMPPGTPLDETPIQLPVRRPDKSIQWFTLPYAKIDMVLPKMTMHCNSTSHPEGASRDYPRGDFAMPPCPVCGSDDVEARPQLPIEQDVTVVRYFIGLRYNDPNGPHFGWKSPWRSDTEAGEENQVVLYRAEFNPFDDTLFPEDMPVLERLADPLFFYRPGFSQQWAEISRVIGVGKYEDLVEGTFDNNGKVMSVEPTITFRFAAIDSDTFAATYSADWTFEYPTASPTVFRATYGYWVPGYSVSVYRDSFNVAYTGDGHTVTRWDRSGDDWTEGETFDIDKYLAGTDKDHPEMAFKIDANRGEAVFALDPPSHSDFVRELDQAAIDKINIDFHDTYAVDKGSARRYWDLIANNNNVPGIVPGSERVIGPNMTPGPNYGNAIRYERVPLALGDPGLNQYKIDYDYGDIFFSNRFDQDLPLGGANFGIDYKIRFNMEGDVVRGDYSTKSLVNIHLGMRMFDPESGKPHAVDLTNSVKVRNAIR